MKLFQIIAIACTIIFIFYWTLANFEKSKANSREIYGCLNKHLQEPELLFLVAISQEGDRELKLYATT
ncbi:MAG: hypothetical protein QNJ53_05150 [Pleurocapsa sp. MO_192.B19]|nr:hypothetical protein [Pleurocapsa sp. MO_192.B19]